LSYFPPSFLYRIGAFISWFFYLAAVKRRRVVIEEISKLFGARFNRERIRMIARRSFKIYVKRQTENMVFGSLTESRLFRLVSIEGLDNMKKSYKKRKGIILLLAHFGSYLLPPAILAYMGYRVHQIAGKPLVDKRRVVYRKVFEARKRQSDRIPFQFHQTDKNLGSAVRALGHGDILVIAFDGRTGSEMVSTKLFNRTAQISPGPFKLSFKTGAALLPTFVVRGGDDKHRLIFESPIEFPICKNREDTIISSMNSFAGLFEKYLLKYPCHFGMTLFTVKKEASKGLNPSLFTD